MASAKYQRILFTGESCWENKGNVENVLKTFVHEILGRDDTLFMISEEAKRLKKKSNIENARKWEEYRLKRLQDRRNKKKKKKKEDDSETEGETSEEEEEQQVKKEEQPKKIKKEKVEKINNFINFEMSKQMGEIKKFNYSKDKKKIAKKNSQSSHLFEEGELDEMIKDSNNIPQPVLYTRDRKIDMDIRNSLMFTGYRVVQYRADWKEKGDNYDTNAGIERNKKIFSLTQPPDIVVIFTNFKKQNEGISHVITLAQKNNTPVIFIDNNLVYSSFEPVEYITTEIIEKVIYDEIDHIELKESSKKLPVIGSEEYKENLEKISKKMKKDLYLIDKHKPRTKILSNKEVLNYENDRLKKLKTATKTIKTATKTKTKTRKTKAKELEDNIVEKIQQLSIEEFDD